MAEARPHDRLDTSSMDLGLRAPFSLLTITSITGVQHQSTFAVILDVAQIHRVHRWRAASLSLCVPDIRQSMVTRGSVKRIVSETNVPRGCFRTLSRATFAFLAWCTLMKRNRFTFSMCTE